MEDRSQTLCLNPGRGTQLGDLGDVLRPLPSRRQLRKGDANRTREEGLFR